MHRRIHWMTRHYNLFMNNKSGKCSIHELFVCNVQNDKRRVIHLMRQRIVDSRIVKL